jgi:phosphoribosylaminoimidazolecarboxamide formyltransferase/IMP cyclohydrolase
MINTVTEIDDMVTLKNVLISVSDKTGLEEFVKGLIQINPGIRIYSTGCTYTGRYAAPAPFSAKSLRSRASVAGSQLT